MTVLRTLSHSFRRNLFVWVLGATAASLILAGLNSTLGTAQQAVAASDDARQIIDFEAVNIYNGYYKFCGVVTPSGPEYPSLVLIQGGVFTTAEIGYGGGFTVFAAYTPEPGDAVSATVFERDGTPIEVSLTF